MFLICCGDFRDNSKQIDEYMIYGKKIVLR